LQKIARVHIGTNNVDSGGYISRQSLLARIDERTQGASRVHALRDIEEAEAIVVLGADPSHSTPVVSYHIKRAAEKGVPLVVADPRQTELSRIASLRLSLKPRSDLELINALCFLLYENQWYDRSFVDQYAGGFSVFRLGLSSFDLERAGRLTGLGVDSLKAAAECIKGRRIGFVIGSGILQQQKGTFTMDAILNLALLTGSLGRPGAGFYILAGENNQMGAMDMGTRPDALPGRAPLRDDGLRREWERAWKTKISPDPGLNMCRMVEEAEKGNLKALYIMGENPLRSLPQQERVQNALKKLDFLVVQDVVKTKTAGIADVVLPGACFSEKDGSYTNLEGRIQTGTAVVSPPGDARPDWEILALLAARMGSSDSHSGLDEIRGEISRRVPMYRDLGVKDESWIASSSGATPSQEKGPAKPIALTPVVSSGEDQPDEAYPFTAILGTLRYHLGSGTRTGRSERIKGFGLNGEIEICPEDADRLGLGDGDRVRAVSRHGEIERGVRLERTVGRGQLFVPLGFNGNDAMDLIGLADLTDPEAQGWKTCQVKLIKAEDYRASENDSGKARGRNASKS
jgi:formate dehydrogenase alpha subunit